MADTYYGGRALWGYAWPLFTSAHASDLYARKLRGWKTKTWKVQASAANHRHRETAHRTECLWANW